MSSSSNDAHYQAREQLASLSVEEALAYATRLFDHHCNEADAAYLREVISAGEQSADVTYRHATEGSPIAQLAYGCTQLQVAPAGGNASEGLFWLRRSFNNGNAKAGLLLANAFLEGRIVGYNPARAFQFASVAADQGLPEGQYFLANLLIGVKGIQADHARAVDLLQAAASSGYAPAAQLLAQNGIPAQRP